MNDQQPWILTAETHSAVEVCADRISADLRARNLASEGIFLIEPASIERTSFDVSSAQESGFLAPSSDSQNDNASISPLTGAKILQQLKHHSEHKPFSLTSHIAQRMFRRDGARMPAAELKVLEDLALGQHSMDAIHQRDFDKECFKKACSDFNRLWEGVQEYYIQIMHKGFLLQRLPL